MSQIGVVNVAAFGVGVVAVDNVVKGHDPFPQLLVGGLFVTACSIVSEIDEGFAMALAATFLVSVLVLHSKSITDVLMKLSKQHVTTTKASTVNV